MFPLNQQKSAYGQGYNVLREYNGHYDLDLVTPKPLVVTQ